MIKKLFLLSIIIFSFHNPTYAASKNVDAIIYGKLVKKMIRKKGPFYYTEYRLKPITWLKKDSKKPEKYLRVRVLTTDLKSKGLYITSNRAPIHIPFNTPATFSLIYTKNKKKNLYTIPADGISLNQISKTTEGESHG